MDFMEPSVDQSHPECFLSLMIRCFKLLHGLVVSHAIMACFFLTFHSRVPPSACVFYVYSTVHFILAPPIASL